MASADLRTIVHDLRNPLNTIVMNCELGKLVLEEQQDAKKAMQLFQVILNECRNCEEQLGKLRELAASKSPPDEKS